MFFSYFFIYLFMSFMLNKSQNLFYFMNNMIICLFFVYEILEYNLMNMFMSMDLMSYMFVLLSMFIVLMMLINMFNGFNKVLSVLMGLMVQVLLYCFFVDSLLLMYVFFEASLVPLMLLILIKGVNLERLSANYYLMIYTLVGSFYFLMMLMLTKMSLSYFLKNNLILVSEGGLLWVFMLMIFMIKLPLYGVHLWLPKAHVEASVEGSMILAGVLLKLGGYGITRVVYFISLNIMNKAFMGFLIVGLVGSILVGMICICQVDIKLMIAYSSVAHMGVVLGGLMSLNKLGVYGSLGLMLGHGFCSSGLFFMSNLFYLKLKTRNLVMMKGIFSTNLLVVNFWLLLSLCNTGVPPFLNFFSEIVLVMSILKISFVLMGLLFVLLVMNLVYGVNMFMRLGQGFMSFLSFISEDKFSEYLLILVHLYFVLVYLFILDYFMIW